MSDEQDPPIEPRLLTPQQHYRIPPSSREIILVRHGSAGGEKMDVRLTLGELTVTDPPLWPEGEAQAHSVGARLSRERVSRIFVTPLQRTQQTAAPLVDLTDIIPIVIPELREVYLGDFEHEFYARAAAGDVLLKRMIAEETVEVLPNAERMEDFSARVRIGIAKILDAMDPGTSAVAFIHAGTIAEICRQATGSRPFAFMGPENGSISRMVIHADGRWALRSFNDIAHLSHA
ncbi:MAG TPA: histidine phosphatase family protein [Steroidobacteraceae bacterium]|nr:histidine phosphatase family protein [Steroidobacteraceae bacterium]